MTAAVIRTCVFGALALGWFDAAPAAAQPAPQKADLLKERRLLEATARKLHAAGKLADALVAAEKVLALERQIHAGDHVEIAESLESLTELQRQLDNLPAARRYADEALRMRSRLHGATHWRTTDARLALDHINVLASLKPAQLASLKDAERQMKQAGKTLSTGKYREGFELAHQALQTRQLILGDAFLTADSAVLAGLLSAFEGNNDRAKPLLELGLAMRRKTLGENPQTAMAAHTLGFVLVNRGEVAAARTQFESAFAIYKATVGLQHAETREVITSLRTTLESLGQASLRKDDFAAARRTMEALFAFEVEVNGDAHWRTLDARLALQEVNQLVDLSPQKRTTLREADDLLKRAQASEKAGNFADGARDAVKAADLRRRTLQSEDRRVGLSLAVAASCLKKSNDLAAARKLLDEALAIANRVLGEHPETALTANELGVLLRELGDFRRARATFERAIEINKKVRPEADVHSAAALNNLGSVLLAQGEYAQARPVLEQAVAIYRKADGSRPTRTDTATALNNLGLLLRDQADYAGAQECYFEALKLHQSTSGPSLATAVTLNNIACLLHDRGNLVGARKYFDQALDMQENLPGRNDYQFGILLNNVGSLLHALGEYKEAGRRFDQALAVQAKALGEEHPTVATTLGNIGELLRDQGLFREALEFHERALTISKNHRPRHLLTANSCNASAVVQWAVGQRAQALDNLEQGLLIEQANLGESFQFVSERAMFAGLERVDFALPVLLSMAAEKKTKTDVDKALTWTLRRKGIVFETVLRFRQAQNLLARDQTFAEKVDRFQALHHRMNNAALNPPPDWTRDKLRAQQATWLKEADTLEAELNAALSRRLPSQHDEWKNVDAAEVRAKLPADGALVEFIRWQPYQFTAKDKTPRWQPARYLAFVLTPQGDGPQMVDLGEAKVIDNAIAELRDHLERVPDPNASIKAYWPEAKALYALVFAPLQPVLGKSRTIFLAADGRLNQVPFEALVDPQGKFLIERYRFAYQSSGRDLLRSAAPRAKGVVVFAGPDFDHEPAKRKSDAKVRGSNWKSLKGAAAEASDIRKTLDGAVVIHDGANALEETLKALAPPRILHLATHGYYFDREAETPAESLRTDLDVKTRLKRADNPLLRSGIVLAGANRIGGPQSDQEDGWVTAAEIGLLNLRGTELVVLSACQTGLGDIKTGEGVFGLRRAFLHAGAESLLTSLFPVPDNETRNLMRQFYSNLKAGRTKLDALHDAQLGIIENGRKNQGEAPHPFFWAGFILVGDPG